MSAHRVVVAVLVGVVGLSLLIVVVVMPAGDDSCAPGIGGVGGGVGWPVGSVVKPTDPARVSFTSGFGPRGGAAHQGIDLAGSAGTPIYAYTDGVVVKAEEASGFGNWIVVDHNLNGQPASTVYGHIFAADLLVHAGDRVRAGQHIANIGYAGEVSPPGPGGAHLHFEIWEGGTRLGGGHAVDPKPAYDAAPAPGNPAAAPAPTPAPTPTPPAPPAAGAELAALPASVGDESHWQIDTVRVARAVHAVFPQITTIGGYRPTDPMPDHPSGRAADITIPDHTSGEGIALGDTVVDYLLSHADELGIEYLIWRQTYIPAHGERSRMQDRGGDTANHDDHVHVTTVGHGFPTGAIHLTAPTAPAAGAWNPTIPPARTDCVRGDLPAVGDELAPGSVPPEFAPWLGRAGRLCPQIRPSLLAAQIGQESGFDPAAVSEDGAQGPAQFMPGTWPGYGRDDDGNGTVSPFDIGDAVMAQGRFMCEIAAQVDGWIAAGKVAAPHGVTELYLAGYNAGPGAVRSNGGFPVDAADYVVQTRPYVDLILANEPRYAAVNR